MIKYLLFLERLKHGSQGLHGLAGRMPAFFQDHWQRSILFPKAQSKDTAIPIWGQNFLVSKLLAALPDPLLPWYYHSPGLSRQGGLPVQVERNTRKPKSPFYGFPVGSVHSPKSFA